jgi:FkbM family methyltransferase
VALLDLLRLMRPQAQRIFGLRRRVQGWLEESSWHYRRTRAERDARCRSKRVLLGLADAAAHSRRLEPLGPSRLGRVKLMWAAVWLPTRRHFRWLAQRPIALPLDKDGHRFQLMVGGVGDLEAIGAVLVEEEYDIPGLEDVRVIVDLGSHIGTSVFFFRLRYPEARIYGCEPDPTSFAKLKCNVGGLAGVTIKQCAVSGVDGESILYSSSHSLASSLVTKSGNRRLIPVRSVRFDSLVDELGLDHIDLLKLDIEGAEYDVLASATRLDSVSAIVGELHPQLIPHSPEEFFDLFDGFEVRVNRASASSSLFQAIRLPASAGTHPR